MAAYGDDAGLTSWLAEHGYVLSDNAPSPAVLRARGTSYVDSYEQFWTGHRTGGVMQELAWPRTGALVNCTMPVPDNVIPPAVVTASYRAAWLESSADGVLTGIATTGAKVKREKIEGAVEVEYFDDAKVTQGAGPSFVDPVIDALLGKFICTATGGAFLWTLGG